MERSMPKQLDRLTLQSTYTRNAAGAFRYSECNATDAANGTVYSKFRHIAYYEGFDISFPCVAVSSPRYSGTY